MSKKHFWLLPIALLFSMVVYAGTVLPVPVVIEYFPGGGAARGDMSTARHSDNEFEHIGCGVRAYETGVDDEVMYWGFCQARLSEEDLVVCNTENKALLEIIYAISDYSYITFHWEGDPGDTKACTFIGNSTQSFYLPFNKDAKKN